jgi:hypothetical protein
VTTTTGPDRLQLLRAENQKAVTGIDFVYVYQDQVTLDVFFLHPPGALSKPLVGDVKPDQIRIYAPSGSQKLPQVTVSGVSWVVIDKRDALQITTSEPGDFTLYRLRIEDTRIDPYFNDVTFSFKANCPSDLDCESPEHECPPETQVDFPVDYQARDFWSFRRALLDFASQRYPDWQDRLEADAGVMLIEVMSALGDELAYYQDRVAREAYLETATQRRSLRRHARLVDYTVHDGLAASAWIDVTASADGDITAGADVWALSDDGQSMTFEIGRGLDETLAAKKYAVKSTLSSLQPHIWDEDDTCLPVGATELHVEGHLKADLTLNDTPSGKSPGRWVLLKTTPLNSTLPARRWLVRLTQVEDETDPLLKTKITRLVWEPAQELPFEMDMTVLEVRGNLVPATAGETKTKYFIIGPTDDATLRPEAIEREGPNGSVAYLFSLPGSKTQELAWVGENTRLAQPEIYLEEVKSGEEWAWRRSLMGTNSSQQYDRHFTLDDGVWERVVGYQRTGEEIVHYDYAADTGKTIRFGDGEFGLIPTQGTVFEVTYRLANGKRDNLAADSITKFESSLSTLVSAVTNPLPVTDGLAPETPTEVRQLAPEAFRAVTYRAVRPKDYAKAAERLTWVQRAGATFRWTGSWLSAFATPDPLGAVTVTESQRTELQGQLDRFRQAGREAHVCDPRYADLDLEITICVEPYAYRGEVKEAVLEALLGKMSVRPKSGFFSSDNFTFGTPLSRSALEAAIQDVDGVRAVKDMTIRRRGWFKQRPFTELVYRVGVNEVIRLENDPLYPERGSLKLIMEGGA